ncbi:MAG: aldo/keto reductase family protein [Planctomycetes bacterium]|nr:aldo/keto reductase family protein [Planctomycetota bacterium]
MLYRPLGSSGLKVSVVGLGSWLTVGNAVDEPATRRLVHAAFERGVNLFDTADVYLKGEAERVLGHALRDLPRHRLVVATKCFFPMSDDPNDRGLSRKHVHQSLAASLRRLQLDYVDLYQCHRPDPDVPLLETAMAMHDLIQRGQVLYWGVSQWPAARIAELHALCAREGLHRPISNQPPYHLFDRAVERDVVPTCQQLGLGQLAYSPLAQGVLTGKYRPGEPLPPGSRATDERQNQFIGRFLTQDHLQRAQRLVELAARHGLTATQVALAFLLRQPNVASVLVGARDERQLAGSLLAIDTQLPPELVTAVDKVFPA